MYSNLTDCPCRRDCPDRVAGCHGSCPKYKAWVAKKDALKKEAAIRREARCLTEATKRAHWKRCRRRDLGVYKKFSQ